MKLKDKLIQAYKDGATRGLSFEAEREKYIQQLEEMARQFSQRTPGANNI